VAGTNQGDLNQGGRRHPPAGSDILYFLEQNLMTFPILQLEELAGIIG